VSATSVSTRRSEPVSFVPVNAYVQRWLDSPELAGISIATAARKLPNRFQFLVSETTGLVFEPALSFLKRKFTVQLPTPEVKQKKSPLSLQAVAYDLKDLFDFLDAKRKGFEDLDVELLNSYVASMTEVRSPITGEPYSDKTIIRRVSSAKLFCAWAQSEGRLKHRFDTDFVEIDLAARDDERSKKKAIAKFAADVEEPDTPDETLHVNVLHPDEAPVLLNALGPLPELKCLHAKRRKSASRLPCRNRLMGECAFQTGLRRAEVVGLTLESLRACRAMEGSAPTRLYAIKVRRKGGKTLPVNFPYWLIEALNKYVTTERAASVEAGRKRDPNYEEPKTVFLNHAHSIRSPGKPVNTETFNEIFHQAQIDAGMSTEDEVTDPATGVKKTVIKVPYVVHDLRHTFAVWTYWRRKRDGDAEPWLYIQAQLGHADLRTTLKIYLRPASLFEAQVSDAYARALKGLIYG